MAPPNTLFMTPEESERVRRMIHDRAERCREQAGQPRKPVERTALVQEATAASVMQDLASASFGFGGNTSKSGDETMVAYAVGRPYPPCTAALTDLEPMGLADLRMETHHRGRVLSVRRASPVVELKASSWAAVQGGQTDEVERLEVFLHRNRYGRDVLDLGAEFLVKEPYYTLSNQGEPTIRVDHPSDLVVSAYSDDPESWRDTAGRSPTTSIPRLPEGKTAAQYKEEGNAALQKQDYARAHIRYTQGLELIRGKEESQTATPDDAVLLRDLHRNRSHVNLLLQRLDEARSDALASLVPVSDSRDDDEARRSLDAKAYFRAGSAAYGLGAFEDAQRYFEEQEKRDPGNQNAKLYLRRIRLRLREAATGTYDVAKIAASLSRTGGHADVADYVGPTEVRESPGAGRGLFATRDVAAGEVIMAEKAFCVVWARDPDALSVLTCDLRDGAELRVFPAGLHRAVVRRLLDNPSRAGRVLELFGDYGGFGGGDPVQRDGAAVVDAFQVHDVVQRNAFGVGADEKYGGDEDVSHASTGLWVRAAYANHSCAPNTRKEHVGDLILLRAARRIAAGEEITHAYDELPDYDARAAALRRTWAFTCHCALCAAEEADGPDLRARRRALQADADTWASNQDPSAARRVAVTKARRLRRALDDTYDSARYSTALPRRALAAIDQWLQLAPSR